jgi:exodeoxyribonuclease V alpha subunit
LNPGKGNNETALVDVLLMANLLFALPSKARPLWAILTATLGWAGMVPAHRQWSPAGRATDRGLSTGCAQTHHHSAHRINEGQIPETHAREAKSDFYFIDRSEPEKITATRFYMVKKRIPGKFHLDPIRDIQMMPHESAFTGVREMDLSFQAELNPARADEPIVEKFGWTFRSRDNLLRVVEKIPISATMRHDLDCCECQLGNLEQAKDWLEKAFKLGNAKKMKLAALNDPDLAPLWKQLGT